MLRAWAEAERTGDVVRQSNAGQTSAEAYARRLIYDGQKRGWLRRGA